MCSLKLIDLCKYAIDQFWLLHNAGLVKPPLKRSRSAPDGGDEENQEQLQDQIAESSSIDEEEKTDNTTLLRLLEEGEKV